MNEGKARRLKKWEHDDEGDKHGVREQQNKYKFVCLLNACTFEVNMGCEGNLYRKSNKKHLSRTELYLHNNQMRMKSVSEE